MSNIQWKLPQMAAYSAAQPSKPPSKPYFKGPDLTGQFEDPGRSYYENRSSHYPTHIGDVIGRKYRIIQKIGIGGSSLVWMARDDYLKQYVALKILKGGCEAMEPSIQQEIDQKLPRPQQCRFIVPIIDSFEIWPGHMQQTSRPTNGDKIHVCLVMEFIGPSLNTLVTHHKDLQNATTVFRAAAKQLAQSLQFLHSAGIIHGDLTDSNILFRIPGIHQWSETDVSRYFGAPKKAPLVRSDGTVVPWAPKEIVEPTKFININDASLVSGGVLITDFGEAFVAGPRKQLPRTLYTPIGFRSPELLRAVNGYLVGGVSNKADIWALGLLIFEMHGFEKLIVSEGPDSQHQIAEEAIVATFGPPPPTVDLGWNVQQQPQNTAQRSLQKRIATGMRYLSREEKNSILDALQRILVYDPRSRPSAQEILGYGWFRS